ncbi:hypothetical protein COX24_02140 [bacterium (Candidatus Gribaldobacteria) CG23_combo_of_CG06-09_8_20_14_all_37_87_8]|uniref:Type II toxin-antitoxin system mRNA interferase toxin, RelE/StbE family n=2 Tax=Candidatus Gribaldobacteria TaxID=2798536 RepID=A0A2G9ZEV4_9BACT|nr:MAG: hypothetical protein AUJ25_02635 [Parcubacteria group bacterium CG1_02_37_13]PIP31706.1 MAG: hypothetical protein COX24_02140 [bacterium (Candidatus Gribaldobacteria) CG23_combo_of_CG06-09_8_20_14_all_37_87_8]PIR90005.1 MAG: hypothetical protein COU05_03460 [bacterium (Candidatus Gribaldobacteria) CG10_big_fil_rev_8_21_14_0_10_37_21]
MKIFYSPHFQRSFQKFSQEIRLKFRKQIDYLLEDIGHPSLKAKKYNRSRQIWQARVDRNIRFYFLIKNGTYILLDIRTHPK